MRSWVAELLDKHKQLDKPLCLVIATRESSQTAVCRLGLLQLR